MVFPLPPVLLPYFYVLISPFLLGICLFAQQVVAYVLFVLAVSCTGLASVG